MPPDSMRIAVFNLVHSTNCGDRLIALTLRKQLETRHAVSACDILANRDAWPSRAACIRRSLGARLVPVLPAFLQRRAVSAWARVKFGLKRGYYDACVRNADFVIVGGGQLFRDNDGYMAGALAVLFRALERHGRRYAVIGCGATGPWGPYAARVFTRFFESPLNVRTVFRDEGAVCVLRGYGIRKDCLVAPDLAFAGGVRSLPDRGGMFGLCVTAAESVCYYGKRGLYRSFRVARRKLLREIAGTVRGKRQVLVFCNGNPEDDRFARQVCAFLRRRFPAIRVELGGRPRSVANLERLLARCGFVCSYRMHVAIMSALLQIPCTLVPWDAKMDFLHLDPESVGRQVAGAKALMERVIASVPDLAGSGPGVPVQSPSHGGGLSV